MTVRRRRRKKVVLAVLALLILGFAAIRICGTLPSLAHRTASTALSETGGTPLGRMITPLVAAHPGVSGIHPLRDGRDAFAARMRLAEAAQRSLDVQYFIWHNDLTGTLLFQALRAAADRGVRVRVLLDDANTPGLDEPIAALDSHPNVEIRLFNPFGIRGPRFLAFLTDFSRLNRRMHNKSFTADNQATIVGGRNIGDRYFGAKDSVQFADLDVLAVGPVVTEVSSSFDRYWASESSYPVAGLLPAAAPGRLAEIGTAAQAVERNPAAVAYMQAVRESSFMRDLAAGTLEAEWAVTRMVSDDPAKGLGRAADEDLVSSRLQQALGSSTKDLKLISPYFVPGAAGAEWLADLAKQGTKIQVLTNSLEGTDVAFVHAGYVKRRKRLLESGIVLYELRRENADPPPGGEREHKHTGSGGSGSSHSSLHAKTFAADHARVFIGSFNFDRRSIRLNTEMGFIIESPRLAGQFDAVFREDIPRAAYEVHLAPGGKMYWTENQGGETLQFDEEPGTTAWQRSWVRFLSWLPIDWLL